jgi:hypothetical protein
MGETDNSDTNLNQTEEEEAQSAALIPVVERESGEHETAKPTKNSNTSNEFPKPSVIVKFFRKPFVSNWAMAIFTAVIALYSILAYCNIRSSSRQTEQLVGYAHTQAQASIDISKAANKFSTTSETAVSEFKKAAKESNDAANRGVENTKTMIKNARESVQNDQRAWLGAGDETYTIAESGPIESSASVQNIGKSPAMNIVCRISGITRPKGHIFNDSDIIYPFELPSVNEGTIFPNQRFPIKAFGPPMDQGKQKAWFAAIQSGDWIAYFFGDVRYKDNFGREHWTHFCTQYVPSTKGGTPCPIYNDTDDSYDKQSRPESH